MSQGKRIYLDHAASSPLKPEVFAAMRPYLTDPSLMGNPSSLHHEGHRAAETLGHCHERVASVFGCAPSDVVFNSGGSEGDTHALLGVALLFIRPLHIVVSAIEHKAVLHAAERLEQLGHRVSYLPVSSDGVVRIEALEHLLNVDRPDIVSVMLVNNEIGTIQPVVELANLCQEREVLFHTDAVQAIGHGLSSVLRDPTIPLLTLTAHKFGGPRGCGVLIQRGLRLPALICGGLQEQGCRAGTENLAGVVGLVTALELAEPTSGDARELAKLRDGFESALREAMFEVVIHGEAAPRAAHISSFSMPGKRAKDLQKRLDRRGFAVGLGSACSGCGRKMSHVLEAMKLGKQVAGGTLRASAGPATTSTDWQSLAQALAETVQETGLRSRSMPSAVFSNKS